MTLVPGTRLGPYEILAAIGAGGMGAVYRGRDTRLNRPVAIKVILEAFAESDARARFSREAQMASALNHPHIVPVYDAGEIDGLQYLVSEYVDGGTLKEWAQRQKRSWREVVEIVTGVADALASAHDARILH